MPRITARLAPIRAIKQRSRHCGDGKQRQRQPDQQPDLGLRHVQFVVHQRDHRRHGEDRHAHGDAGEPEHEHELDEAADRRGRPGLRQRSWKRNPAWAGKPASAGARRKKRRRIAVLRLRALWNKYRTLAEGTVMSDLAAAAARASHDLRLRDLPAGAGRHRRRHSRRPRCAGGDADRQRQVAVLPAAGAPSRRPHHRGVAVDRADAQSGGATARLWRRRGGAQLGERCDGEPVDPRSASRAANCASSMWRRNGW